MRIPVRRQSRVDVGEENERESGGVISEPMKLDDSKDKDELPLSVEIPVRPRSTYPSVAPTRSR
jgi:hypothetical protein